MRFINEDIVTGDISNSNSLNRYSYVEGNPVTMVDPFGLCPNRHVYTLSNQGRDMLKEFEASSGVLKKSGIGFFDDDDNLIGIYPHYVFKLKDGEYISDGGITFGYGHYVSQLMYEKEEVSRVLVDTYAQNVSIIPQYIPEDGRSYPAEGSIPVPMECVDELFMDDISYEVEYINNFLYENNIELTQNQFDVIVSFHHQYGIHRLDDPDREMTKFLLKGDFSDEEVRRVFGLHEYQERRKKEAEVFIYGY